MRSCDRMANDAQGHCAHARSINLWATFPNSGARIRSSRSGWGEGVSAGVFHSAGMSEAFHSSGHPDSIHLEWPRRYFKNLRSLASSLDYFTPVRAILLQRLRLLGYPEHFLQSIKDGEQRVDSRAPTLTSDTSIITLWLPMPYHPTTLKLRMEDRARQLSIPWNSLMLIQRYGKWAVCNSDCGWMSGGPLYPHTIPIF